MANRTTLAISKLDLFDEFMTGHYGFIIATTKSEWEIRRYVNKNETVILYTKSNAKEHVTVRDRDMAYVTTFLRVQKMKEEAHV